MNAIQLTIGTYTQGPTPGRGIVHAAVAPDGSGIEVLTVTPFTDPSWVVRSPDGRFFYPVSEAEQGQVAAFDADVDGTVLDTPLRRLAVHPTGGAEPCHASLIGGGSHLAVANYASGSLSVHPIGADGLVGARTCLVQHTGSGPDPDRQAGPHVHMVTEDPAGRYVLAIDLGVDSIFGYELDAGTGTLRQVARTRMRPGFGPRHLVFHPDGRHAYVIGELGFTVAACTYDAQRAELTVLREVPVLENGVPGPDRPAGIQISRDARFLYTSTRGRDEICVLSLAAGAGKPELVATVPARGSGPREIALSPDGTLLLSANEPGNSVTVFRIDPANGIPQPTGAQLDLPTPTCLVMA
jgi:6-phosphogluconolactonase